ncbi:MAG: hypothetical protein ACSHX7_11760 [Luteolibacter sp.]
MPDFSAQDDQTLLKAFVHEGNKGSFSELVKRHHAMAYTDLRQRTSRLWSILET